eukprot:50296-Rhodomonas_salina.2
MKVAEVYQDRLASESLPMQPEPGRPTRLCQASSIAHVAQRAVSVLDFRVQEKNREAVPGARDDVDGGDSLEREKIREVPRLWLSLDRLQHHFALSMSVSIESSASPAGPIDDSGTG